MISMNWPRMKSVSPTGASERASLAAQTVHAAGSRRLTFCRRSGAGARPAVGRGDTDAVAALHRCRRGIFFELRASPRRLTSDVEEYPSPATVQNCNGVRVAAAHGGVGTGAGS